jgi:hypothetical protein
MPDLLGIVLYPPGLRIDLLMFVLLARNHFPGPFKDDEARAGRTLIDGAKIPGHARFLAWLLFTIGFSGML